MPNLFSPMTLGKLTLPNRIVLPPMCQYSADNGVPTKWHFMHYGQFAASGLGLMIVEACAVVPEGRISPFDLGIWSDDLTQEHKALLDFIRSIAQPPIALQLGHAGRKAAVSPPWTGGEPLSKARGGWKTVAPSPLKHAPEFNEPTALEERDLAAVIKTFAEAARRADNAGYDAVEIHAAHGYLLHQFLSPTSNIRKDKYGGGLENRMRLPLEVFKAVRKNFSADKPVGIRISGSDFTPDGWDVESSVVFARALKSLGCSYIHVSGGGLSPAQTINLAPGYQVSMAAAIKAATDMPTIAVGLITEPELAAGIIEAGLADMTAIGRGMLYNPRWPWHAAAKLSKNLRCPNQYLRCEPRNAKGLFESPSSAE